MKKGKDDFEYSLSTEDNEIQEQEYEKLLEKDIETASLYVDKLELTNDLTDEELLSKSKQEIIDYKNANILKLKAYITSLSQEKNDLIENYKNSTNNLLERIKELEKASTGLRPETPMITKNIRKGVNTSNFPSLANKGKTKRCPNCAKDIDVDSFFEHSLECLRKKFHCTICDTIIDDKDKKKHIEHYTSKATFISSIKNNELNLFKKCIEHGFEANAVIDSDNNTALHLICKLKNLSMLKELLAYNIDMNIQNKNKETALIVSIDNNAEDCAMLLIKKGANVALRKRGDVSPLMLACKYGNVSIVKALLLNGADINEKNILGENPLKIAQMNNHEDLAMMLLKEFNSNLKFAK